MLKSPQHNRKGSNMSQMQFTLDLIGIKDQKIHVHDASASLEQECIGGVLPTHKIIHATLAPPENSPCQTCASPTQKGGKSTSDIPMPKIAAHPTILRLDKAGSRCTACKTTKNMTTSLVGKNCFISKATRQQSMIHATETFSEKTIAKLNDVSPSAISRVLTPLL